MLPTCVPHYFREVAWRMATMCLLPRKLYSQNAGSGAPPCSSDEPPPVPSCSTVTPPPAPLPPSVRVWLEDMCDLLLPECMHIMEGSAEERQYLVQQLLKDNVIIKLRQEDNCLLVRSHECDDGRDESRVFTSALNISKFIPLRDKNSKYGPLLGNVMQPSDTDAVIKDRFYRAMKGKRMFVIPFMLGPIDAEVKLFGIQVTDSALCALMTSIMARVGNEARNEMVKHLDPEDSKEDVLIKLIHCTGRQKDSPANWPFDREKYIIINMPGVRTVWSYGSSHWDNSVLVKDSAALQMAQFLLKDSNILPLNMSVMSVEKILGEKKYIGMIGATGSGKSVLASLRGKTELCPLNAKIVSDDVTWLKQDCRMKAINPLTGLDPYVRGVNEVNTPALHLLSSKQCLLLNTGMSGQDTAWWEGKKLPNKDDLKMTDWRGSKWRQDGPRAAHLNSRIFGSMHNVEDVDDKWQSGAGVALDAIMILTRRHRGHPLIMEIDSWSQAMYHLATIRTRYHTTPLDSNDVHWEPFGNRRLLGYNLGTMIEDWMSLSMLPASYKPAFPKFYLVNLFQMDPMSKDLVWTGYEDNKALIDWILERLDGEPGGQSSPMGILPTENDFILPDNVQYTLPSLVPYDSDFWRCEFHHVEELMMDQLPNDIPQLFCRQFHALKKRVNKELQKQKLV